MCAASVCVCVCVGDFSTNTCASALCVCVNSLSGASFSDASHPLSISPPLPSAAAHRTPPLHSVPLGEPAFHRVAAVSRVPAHPPPSSPLLPLPPASLSWSQRNRRSHAWPKPPIPPQPVVRGSPSRRGPHVAVGSTSPHCGQRCALREKSSALLPLPPFGRRGRKQALPRAARRPHVRLRSPCCQLFRCRPRPRFSPTPGARLCKSRSPPASAPLLFLPCSPPSLCSFRARTGESREAPTSESTAAPQPFPLTQLARREGRPWRVRKVTPSRSRALRDPRTRAHPLRLCFVFPFTAVLPFLFSLPSHPLRRAARRGSPVRFGLARWG